MTTKLESQLKEIEEFFTSSRRVSDGTRRQTAPGEERTRHALLAWSQGEICRGDAMDLLEIDWYGDLLDALPKYRIDRPDAHLTAEDRAALERVMPMLAESLDHGGDPKSTGGNDRTQWPKRAASGSTSRPRARAATGSMIPAQDRVDEWPHWRHHIGVAPVGNISVRTPYGAGIAPLAFLLRNALQGRRRKLRG